MILVGDKLFTPTGETIRHLREAAGLSRRDLAGKAGIAPVFVAKLEQGERRPSPQTLGKIARALDLSTSDLVAKIAIFQASAAPTSEEMQRGMIRAATIAGGATLVGGIPGLAAVGMAALATRYLQKLLDESADNSQAGIDELRMRVMSKVRSMPVSQLTMTAALIDEIEVSAGTEANFGLAAEAFTRSHAGRPHPGPPAQ